MPALKLDSATERFVTLLREGVTQDRAVRTLLEPLPVVDRARSERALRRAFELVLAGERIDEDGIPILGATCPGLRWAPDGAAEAAAFGGHAPAFPDALTLFEVGALLSRAAHAGGCAHFAEYPAAYVDGRRGQRIDHVWAVRARALENGRRWVPIAAFEIEGIDVGDESLQEDVARFHALAGEHEAPADEHEMQRVVVLYRTTESGQMFWRPGHDARGRELELVTLAKGRVAAHTGNEDVQVVLDRDLLAEPIMSGWIRLARARVEALRRAQRV